MSELEPYPDPATAEAIEAVCKVLGLSRQSWPASFWQRHDGAFLIDLVRIYPVSDIEERNHTYEVPTYFPDWVAVGDDSGGRLILADRHGSNSLYLVDAGAGSFEQAQRFESLDELLQGIIDEFN